MFKLLVIITVLGSWHLPLPQGCLPLCFAEGKGRRVAVVHELHGGAWWQLPDLQSGGCVIVAVIALLEAPWAGAAELGEVLRSLGASGQ